MKIKSVRSCVILIAVLFLLTVQINARWIVGHQQVVDGKPIGLCNLIGGFCGDIGLPKVKFDAIRRGQFVLLDEEPKTDVAAEVEVKIERGKMLINILKLKGTDKFFFDIERDMPLDDTSAKSLGFRSVIVKKGSYPTCYTTGKPNGTTVLDVVAR